MQLRAEVRKIHLTLFDRLKHVACGRGAILTGFHHGEADRRDEKDDPEPGRDLLENISGVRAESGIEGAAAERCTETFLLGTLSHHDQH